MSTRDRPYVLPGKPDRDGFPTPAFGTVVGAWCPVCRGGTVKVIKLAAVDLNDRFAATCHGSTEYASFSHPAMLAGDRGPYEVPRVVEEWLRKVFEGDTQPDVMLAIRYGQGQTMKESVK